MFRKPFVIYKLYFIMSTKTWKYSYEKVKMIFFTLCLESSFFMTLHHFFSFSRFQYWDMNLMVLYFQSNLLLHSSPAICCESVPNDLSMCYEEGFDATSQKFMLRWKHWGMCDWVPMGQVLAHSCIASILCIISFRFALPWYYGNGQKPETAH